MKLFSIPSHRLASIRFRLHFLLFLLASIMLGLVLSLTTSDILRSLNSVYSQTFHTAESYLTSVSYTISALENASLYLVSYSLYNDSSILEPLSSRSFENSFLYKSQLHSLYSSYLQDKPLDFVAIYDMQGCGIYVDITSPTYSDCYIREQPEWYTSVAEKPFGAVTLYDSDSFSGSGCISENSFALCAVRGITDTVHWKTVGAAVAGVSASTMNSAFYQTSSLPDQQAAVYLNGELVFSTSDGLPAFPRSAPAPGRQLSFSGRKPALNYTVSDGETLTVMVRTPLSGSSGLYPNLPLIFTVFLILLLFLLVIWQLIRDTLHSLQLLTDACNAFANNTIPSIPSREFPEELHDVFHAFNQMSHRVNSLIHDVLIKNMEKKDTELQLLRTQINPHYLYNTLEIIHMTAYMKQDYQVASMAECLGKNLQYGLRNTISEVSIADELKQLDVYLTLIRYQYGPRLSVNIFIESQLYDCRILKLIFQPVVENSILHGFEDSDQTLNIDIFGYEEDGSICFKISDNGKGINEAELKKIQNDLKNYAPNRIGIFNLHRRIQLSYGSEYGLDIDSIEHQQTVVTIRLPFQPSSPLQDDPSEDS